MFSNLGRSISLESRTSDLSTQTINHPAWNGMGQTFANGSIPWFDYQPQMGMESSALPATDVCTGYGFLDWRFCQGQEDSSPVSTEPTQPSVTFAQNQDALLEICCRQANLSGESDSLSESTQNRPESEQRPISRSSKPRKPEAQRTQCMMPGCTVSVGRAVGLDRHLKIQHGGAKFTCLLCATSPHPVQREKKGNRLYSTKYNLVA